MLGLFLVADDSTANCLSRLSDGHLREIDVIPGNSDIGQCSGVSIRRIRSLEHVNLLTLRLRLETPLSPQKNSRKDSSRPKSSSCPGIYQKKQIRDLCLAEAGQPALTFGQRNP